MIEKCESVRYNTNGMEQRRQKLNWFTWNVDHVGVLDGIRAIAILTVLWFHFWQQTWLMPYYPAPFLAAFGIKAIDFNPIRRSGYLAVDLMILLSGFVLFLPYARQRILGSSVDSIGTFYRKRAARILPSYVFAVLVMFFIALLQGVYHGKPEFMWRDLGMHLTLTFMLRPDTYLFSGINGVFWTVVIEVLFYAIFPFVGKLFQKWPIRTYLGMAAIGLGFTFGFALKQTDQISFLVNRFPTFLPVFANGMLGAYLYVWIAKKAPLRWLFSICGTIMAAAALIVILRLLQSCSASKTIQVWQLTWRYPLSTAYLAFVLGLCISAKPIRFLLSNRVFAAIAGVSYNLYLWHQFLIVRLRMALGCQSGADVAALGANTQWMLNMEALVFAFAIAILTTFCMERPVYRLIMGQGPHKI